jgi:hypothetical protein
MCEYAGGKPVCVMKVKVEIFALTTDFFSERFEYEHICMDPKDGELCLSRMKPGETLVEVRSDTDVQIVRQTWV